MGANNYGNANITFRYKHPAKAENFNSVLRGVCPSGIYRGGTVSYIGNILTLAPYTAIFESSIDKATTITTTSSIDLSTVTTFGGNASSATPYVIMRYTYSNIISNYPDYYQVVIGDIQSTDIIICKVLFDGGGVVNGIDYSESQIAPQYSKDLDTYNIFCDTYVKGKKINKELTTAIDVNMSTSELLCDTSLFFTPTADRTLDITAGASFEDTDLYVYNNGTDHKITTTYFETNTFDVLPSGFVKFKWNGTRWIIIESNSQEFLGWEECFYSLSRTAEIDGTNHIYELTVTGDKTAYFKAGQKIKFTQDASTKYAIITYVETSGGNTILTVYGGTDYAISANAITSVRLAKVNRPYDFNCNEEKWTISVDFAGYSRSSPAANTLYYTGNSFNGEKGSWKYKSKKNITGSLGSTATNIIAIASESSASSVNSFLSHVGRGYASFYSGIELMEVKTYSSRTPIYYLISCNSSGVSGINFLGTSEAFTGLKITPCGL